MLIYHRNDNNMDSFYREKSLQRTKQSDSVMLNKPSNMKTKI